MKKLSLLLIVILPLFLNAQKNTDEWTVAATYEIPGKSGGLTYDGEFLYSGLYSAPGDDNLIYQIDPSDGSYQLHCVASQDKSYGLTFDGTYLWSTDRQGSYDPALAVQFDDNGNLLSSFELPATYISGIEYMADGSFWVCAYYDPDGTAFHVDASGNILGQFDTPSVQPWAICQIDENFWIADYDADMLYLVDETGQVLESHESIGVKPTGVVYDGEFLWYTTGPSQSNSTLYKIDMSGGGNPELDIQPQEFNIGSVLVDSNQEFAIDFINSGTGDGSFNTVSLTGTGTNIISLNNLASQVDVAAGETVTVTVDMDFLSPGVFDVVQLFSTTDPMNTEIEVHFFGEITNDGPVLQTNLEELNFTNVRKFATTRRWIQLINTGSSNLEISSIEYGSGHFSTDNSSNFPINIGSLDTMAVGIWFTPQNIGDFNTSMTINHNDPNSPLNMDIIANAVDQDHSIGSLLWDFQIT
ncbi:MAG: choice-of-anchor D domain-containing protein, partial [Bacteroidales bacterium]|nr:choice-of-anchor D domain-containing protein [Bacteroidales bacterium]